MKATLFTLLLFVFAIGCTDPTIGIVSGKVTVDGESPETGSMAFIPVDGKTGTAGTTIINGEYTATVPVGLMKVEIRVPKIVGQVKIYNTPDSPIQDKMEESLPAMYNDETELTYEVPSGKSQKDYELAAKKKRKK